MKKTMKAAVLVKPKKMEIKNLPIPSPEQGWVRIKNKAAGICGSDMHIYTGNHPWLKPGNPMAKYVLGNVYGHEVAGIVDELGAGVTKFKKGDRVALDSIVPCGKCRFCRVGQYQICEDLKHYGFHYPGGFAEYMIVPQDNLYIIPDSLSFEVASTLDVLVVGLHATNKAKISLADKVIVLGAGPIGIAIVSAVKEAGAREIFVTAKYDIQKKVLQKIGIKKDNILDPYDKKLEEIILDKTHNLGVDCAIESIGYKAKTIDLGISLIRKGGRVIFTGVFEEQVCLDFGKLLVKEASIIASHAFGMWNLVPEFELALDFLKNKKFPAKEIITHRFSLDEINTAFQQKLRNKEKAFKVVITF